MSDRLAPALLTAMAAILAFPGGWFAGVVLAELIAGPDFGVLPAATIPFCLAAALIVAFWPRFTAAQRFGINAMAAVLSFALMELLV